MNRNRRIGVLLIALGVLALAGQLGFLEGIETLYVLSLVFLAVYFLRAARRYYWNVWWLIPSLVLFAAALSISAEDMPGVDLPEGSILFFLAAAFLAVYFIHTRVAGFDWFSRYLPLLATGVLLVVGFINNPNFFGDFTYVIAAALVLAGLYLMRRPGRR